MGIGQALVSAKKNVSACTVTETVTCEVALIHTSELSEPGVLKPAGGAGGEPRDCAHPPVCCPRCPSAEELAVPGVQGLSPVFWSDANVISPGTKCKYNLIFLFLFLSTEGTRCHRNSIGEPAR